MLDENTLLLEISPPLFPGCSAQTDLALAWVQAPAAPGKELLPLLPGWGGGGRGGGEKRKNFEEEEGGGGGALFAIRNTKRVQTNDESVCGRREVDLAKNKETHLTPGRSPGRRLGVKSGL